MEVRYDCPNGPCPSLARLVELAEKDDFVGVLRELKTRGRETEPERLRGEVWVAWTGHYGNHLVDVLVWENKVELVIACPEA